MYLEDKYDHYENDFIDDEEVMDEKQLVFKQLRRVTGYDPSKFKGNLFIYHLLDYDDESDMEASFEEI